MVKRTDKTTVNGEILQFRYGWYSDYLYSLYRNWEWIIRGGDYRNGANAGVFNADHDNGNAASNYSSRLVITP